MAIGDITGPLDDYAFSTNDVNYARGVSIVHARDNIYVGISRHTYNDAEAVSVSIDAEGQISAALATFTFTRGFSYRNAYPVASIKIADGVILIAWGDNSGRVQLDTLAVDTNGVISAIDNAAVLGDDVLQIHHIAGDVYAFTCSTGDITIVTISVSASGNITVIDTHGIASSFDKDPVTMSHAIGNIYVIAGYSASWYTRIYTIEIADNGTIGDSFLDSISFDTHSENVRPDLFKISDGVVGFAAIGRITRKVNIVTFSVPIDGALENANIIDSLANVLLIDDEWARPFIRCISLNDNLYALTAVQGNDPNSTWVATVEITPDGNITDSPLDRTSGGEGGYPPFRVNWGDNYTPFIHMGNGLCCMAIRYDGGMGAYLNTFRIEVSLPAPPISGTFVFAEPVTAELEPNFTPFDPKLKHVCDHYLSDGQYRLAKCPRCLGTGYYFDIKFNDVGRVTQVPLSDKLAQTFEKFVITKENIFHPEVAINVPQWLGNVNLSEIRAAIKFDLMKALMELQEAQKGAPNLTDQTQIGRVADISVYSDSMDPTKVYYTVTIITVSGQARAIEGTIILNR